MHEAVTDGIADATFGAIAARAARFPVIVRSSQPRAILKGSARDPVTTNQVTADPGIRWLLLNTRATNRFLEETGWSEHQFATKRCLKGTV